VTAALLAASTLPDNVGYVAAAYLVFLALILVYVAIMATKLGRVERELAELNTLAEKDAGAASASASPQTPPVREPVA
jgi:hypothetical protein